MKEISCKQRPLVNELTSLMKRDAGRTPR